MPSPGVSRSWALFGEPLAILDFAWLSGLQEGLSAPAALLINEGRETEEIVNRAGYRFFTSVEAFHEYVEREILALEDVGESEGVRVGVFPREGQSE